MSDREPASAGGDLAERLVLAALAAVASAAAFVWLWGGAASVLHSGVWAGVGGSQLAGVLADLPQHLDQPRDAWPAATRSQLPEAPIFYVALVCLAVGAAATAWIVVRGTRVLRRPGRRGARWGTGADVRSLATRRAVRGRVIVGRVGRRLIAAEARQSVIVIAPTQSGKTTGLAIPALLEWDGPVLATSVKTDLVRDTLARRQALGEVKVYDPTGVTGLAASAWTPLSGCDSWPGARRTAERLARAAQPTKASNESEFWAKSGARFLAPLLFAAARSGGTMRDVVRWIDTDAQEQVAAALDGSVWDAPSETDVDDAAPALAALQAVWGSDDRLRSSLYMTASVALDAYNDPRVADSASASELTPEWLLDGGCNAAFLCATADEQQRLRPLFVTLIEEVVATVFERAAATGKPVDPPLLVVLDEAANIAPLPHLDALAATGAGQGIQLVTVVQDLSQMQRQWPGAAETIVNNHRAKLIGSGISCPTTLQYVARMLGDEEIRQTSTSTGHDGRRSSTDAPNWRALAPANVLRESRSGTAVLVYGNRPPAWTKLRPWYRERSLRRLARG